MKIGMGFVGLVLGLSSASAWAQTKVLLSAFEPFGGEDQNASQQMLEAFAQSEARAPIACIELDTIILPVVYGDAENALMARIDDDQPDVVISFGEAGGQPDFRVENVAQDLDDSSMPDNAGVVRLGQPILIGGAATYTSGLPTRVIRSALAKKHFPVVQSQSAGNFLCNHVFYQLMRHVAESGDKTVAGFIHVPGLPPNTSMSDWAAWGQGAIDMAVRAVLTSLPRRSSKH